MFSRVAASVVFIAAASAAPLCADARSDAKAQVAFGIDVAQKGLWREAIYRWEKAAQIDPTYAAAYNDLAIGYNDIWWDRGTKAMVKPAWLTFWST